MGVTQLWQILGPVEQHQPLASLAGLTLAVDLSIWVCETQCVKQMQGVVSKPFLRNLFFRISHLTQLGVKLVFVIEGSAPELKWEIMMKRQQSRFPGRTGKPAGKQTRKNFNACLKECCLLLDILGIPYVQSRGEAEAMCAMLDANGLVDGCLTNDGDSFLYGARTVYRNFTMNSKDPHVEMYRMNDIETKLGIDRQGLVALGLLLGCDFVPKGVPGIGVANSLRLLASLQGQDILQRMKDWRCIMESECVDQVEILARRKAIGVPDFPQLKVVSEFLVSKDRCPSQLSPWKRPVPDKLQEFALIKLEWPVEYTLEKVLPLVTLWDMQDLLRSRTPSTHQHLKPHRIVKSRVRQGISCYEVEWNKPVTDSTYTGDFYVTIEIQDIFTKCHPDLVKEYEASQEIKKKKTTKGKKKKAKETPEVPPISLDNLSFNFDKMNIRQVTNTLQASVKELQPTFTEYDENSLLTKVKAQKQNIFHQPAVDTDPFQTSAPNVFDQSWNGESSVSKSVPTVFQPVQNTDSKSVQNKDKNLETKTSNSDGGELSLGERIKLRMKNKEIDALQQQSNIENDKHENVVNGHDNLNTTKDISSNQTDDVKQPVSKSAKRRASKRISKIASAANTPQFTTPQSRHPMSHNGTLELSNIDSLMEDIGNMSLHHRNSNQFPQFMSNQNTPSAGQGHTINNRLAKNLAVKQMDFKMSPNPSTFADKLNSTTPFSLTRSFSTADHSQKMSSPSSEAFCSPGTYMKQTFNGDNSEQFQIKDSPISVDAYNQSRGFIDTMSKSSKMNGFCQHTPELKSSSLSSTKMNCQGDPTLLNNDKGKPTKGTWVTEKVKEFVTDNGEKFSFNVTKQTNNDSLYSVNTEMNKFASPMMAKDFSKVSSANTLVGQNNGVKLVTTPFSEPDMDISNLSQFGEFNIQHSLLNSLCASLMHALTPKGIPQEEYDQLKDSLQKIQSEQKGAMDEAGQNKDVVCNINFADVERALKQVETSEKQTKVKTDSPSSPVKLTKTAKRKLQRNRKLLRESFQSTENENEQKSTYSPNAKRTTSESPKTHTKAIPNLKSPIINNDKMNVKHIQSNLSQNISENNHQKKTNQQKLPQTKSVANSPNNSPSKPQAQSLKKSSRRKKDKHKTALAQKFCDSYAELSSSLNELSEQPIPNENIRSEDVSITVDSKDNQNSKNKMKKTSLSKTENQTLRNGSKIKEKMVQSESLQKTSAEFITPEMATPEDIENNKKKKKKRKKSKHAKASPLIDFSADETFFIQSQAKVCEDYLKKALGSKPDPFKSQIPRNKIEKASPIMDLSADDTLLELEALSTVITDTDFDTKTREKLKLAYQKTLVKQRLKSTTESNLENLNKPVLGSVSEPVLAMNGLFQSKNSAEPFRGETTDVCINTDSFEPNENKHSPIGMHNIFLNDGNEQQLAEKETDTQTKENTDENCCDFESKLDEAIEKEESLTASSGQSSNGTGDEWVILDVDDVNRANNDSPDNDMETQTGSSKTKDRCTCMVNNVSHQSLENLNVQDESKIVSEVTNGSKVSDDRENDTNNKEKSGDEKYENKCVQSNCSEDQFTETEGLVNGTEIENGKTTDNVLVKGNDCFKIDESDITQNGDTSKENGYDFHRINNPCNLKSVSPQDTKYVGARKKISDDMGEQLADEFKNKTAKVLVTNRDMTDASITKKAETNVIKEYVLNFDINKVDKISEIENGRCNGTELHSVRNGHSEISKCLAVNGSGVKDDSVIVLSDSEDELDSSVTKERLSSNLGAAKSKSQNINPNTNGNGNGNNLPLLEDEHGNNNKLEIENSTACGETNENGFQASSGKFNNFEESSSEDEQSNPGKFLRRIGDSGQTPKHSLLDKTSDMSINGATKDTAASPLSLADRLRLKLKKSTRSVFDSFKGGK